MPYSCSRKQHIDSNDSSASQAAEQALARVVLYDSSQALTFEAPQAAKNSFS
jgi:hypothetical protein